MIKLFHKIHGPKALLKLLKLLNLIKVFHLQLKSIKKEEKKI